MSLFGGIFQFSGSSGGLFSDASQYKAHSSTDPPVEQPPQQPDPEQPKKKRKHDTTADNGLAKVHTGIAAAQAAVKAATPSGNPDNQHKQAKAADGAITLQQAHKKARKQHVVTQSPAQSPGQAAVQQLPEQQAQQVHLQQTDKQLKKQKRKKQLDKQHTGQAEKAVAGSGKTAGIRGRPQAPAAGAPAAAVASAAQVTAVTAPPQAKQQSNTHDVSVATTSTAETATEQQQQQQDEDPVAAAEKLSRTIFVGNLPVTVKAKALRRRFAEYGPVESVRLRSVPLDLESKKKLPRKAAVIKGSVSADRGGAKAYVVFEDAAAAEAALAANMTQLEGHHIRVDRAAPPSAAAAAAAGGGGDAGSGRGGGSEGVGSVLYDAVRSVFVGNLDWKISDEELIRVFSDGEQQPELVGTVEAVRVVRDSHTNLGKGIAYVLFTTKAAARAALQLDGHKLGKRAMRVSRVSRKASATGNGKAVATGAARRLGGRAPTGLGVRNGGIQKQQQRGQLHGQQQQRHRTHQTESDGTAADWQGLRTKGKGGFRGSGAASGKKMGVKPGGGRPGGGSGDVANKKSSSKGKAGKAKSKGGKRPAVAARKAAQKAAVMRKKRS